MSANEKRRDFDEAPWWLKAALYGWACWIVLGAFGCAAAIEAFR